MPNVRIKTDAAVVYVLRKTSRGHEVLLLKRSKNDSLDKLWLSVAGKIEEGETASQTGLRELGEETGLVPNLFYAAGFCEQFYSWNEDAICILPVFIAFVDESQEVKLNREHAMYKWFTMEEAYQAVSLHNHRECLDMIKRSFIENVPSDFAKIKAA